MDDDEEREREQKYPQCRGLWLHFLGQNSTNAVAFFHSTVKQQSKKKTQDKVKKMKVKTLSQVITQTTIHRMFCLKQ